MYDVGGCVWSRMIITGLKKYILFVLSFAYEIKGNKGILSDAEAQKNNIRNCKIFKNTFSI